MYQSQLFDSCSTARSDVTMRLTMRMLQGVSLSLAASVEYIEIVRSFFFLWCEILADEIFFRTTELNRETQEKQFIVVSVSQPPTSSNHVRHLASLQQLPHLDSRSRTRHTVRAACSSLQTVGCQTSIHSVQCRMTSNAVGSTSASHHEQ